jgi:hypothetical protein
MSSHRVATTQTVGCRVLTETAMMSTAQVFTRVVAIALLVSAVDAVSGRVLQASPDPSLVLSLGATAWVSYRLAQGGQARLSFIAGVTMWAVYMAAFVLWAWLLIGWNQSAPWHPRSTTWMIAVAASAPVVAIVAQLSGTGSRMAKSEKASEAP